MRQLFYSQHRQCLAEVLLLSLCTHDQVNARESMYENCYFDISLQHLHYHEVAIIRILNWQRKTHVILKMIPSCVYIVHFLFLQLKCLQFFSQNLDHSSCDYHLSRFSCVPDQVGWMHLVSIIYHLSFCHAWHRMPKNVPYPPVMHFSQSHIFAKFSPSRSYLIESCTKYGPFCINLGKNVICNNTTNCLLLIIYPHSYSSL